VGLIGAIKYDFIIITSCRWIWLRVIGNDNFKSMLVPLAIFGMKLIVEAFVEALVEGFVEALRQVLVQNICYIWP